MSRSILVAFFVFALTLPVARAGPVWEYGVLSVADVYSKDRSRIEDQEYSWTVDGTILFASRSGSSFPALIQSATGNKVDPNLLKGGNDFEPWRVTVMNAFGKAGWELAGVQSRTGKVLGVDKSYQIFWMKRLKP